MAGLAATILALVGCAPAADAGSIRIATVNNVVVEALVTGLRAGAGLPAGTTASFTELPAPDALRAALTSGQVDMAFLPVTSAANLARRNVDVRLLGVVDYPLFTVVGPADAGSGWAGLRGRTITTAFRGDVTDFVVRALGTAAGLQPERDLLFDYRTQLPDVAADLATGRAEIGVLPDIAAARVVASSDGRLAPLVDLGAEWRAVTGHDLPWMAVVVRGEFAVAAPQTVQALQQQLIGAATAVRDDPVAAASPVAAATDDDPALVESVLRQASPQFRTARAAQGDLAALFDRIMSDAPGLIGGGLPDDRFYN
ncbi:MAG: ABC transporter substrate-binding protein [Pseudonocardia sp.]